MASVGCSRHPEEKLRFMCLQCSVPICRDCKLTQHEGHRTTDIDLVASDLRQRLLQEKKKVESCQTSINVLQSEMQSALERLDSSVEEERGALKKKVGAVMEWAQTYQRVIEKTMQELQQQCRAKMKPLVDYLDHNATYLQQLTTAMTEALKEEAGGDRVARVLSDYEHHHKGHFPTHRDLSINMATHSYLLHSMASSPDLCQAAVERYLGCPLVTHVVKGLPSSCQWNFSTRVERSKDHPHRVVTDLLPLKDGTLCVIYQDGPPSDASTSRLAYYSPDGVKRREQVVGEGEVMMVEPTNCQIALFSVASETWQYKADSRSSSTDEPGEGKVPAVVFLKEDQKVIRVWEVTCSSLPGRAPASTVLAELEVPVAIKVKVSNGGDYIAVLKTRQQVVVYQRHTTTPLSTFNVTSELEQAELQDMCFGQVWQRELLMMAEGFYSVILLADPLHNCLLNAFFPSPLSQPTCVRADGRGQLWIGSEGGGVVKGSLLPPQQENEDELEEDAEGYLVPSTDLYVNIRLLGPQTPSSKEPPLEEPPPPPGLPDLPPRLRRSKVIDTDPMGMPLAPPPSFPSAVAWIPPPHPALEEHILHRRLYENAEEEVRTVDQTVRQRVSPPGRQDGGKPAVPLPPAADLLTDYENVDCQPDPSDGEPGGERQKPHPTPPPPPASASLGRPQRESWTPTMMMEPPKIPSRFVEQPPHRPPKSAKPQPRIPPRPVKSPPKHLPDK